MDFYKVTFSFPWTKQILFDESETDGIKISEQCNDIIWLSSMAWSLHSQLSGQRQVSRVNRLTQSRGHCRNFITRQEKYLLSAY